MKEGLISSGGGNLRVPLLFGRGSWAVYPVSNRESGLDVCGGMEFCFPLELSKGFQALAELNLGPGALFELATGASEVP